MVNFGLYIVYVKIDTYEALVFSFGSGAPITLTKKFVYFVCETHIQIDAGYEGRGCGTAQPRAARLAALETVSVGIDL